MVGLVRGVHGLKGAVRVEILSDNPERFAVGSVLHREGDARPLTIVSSQLDGPGMLVRFKEIRDRGAADSLRNSYLEGRVEALPDDAFYWHDIIGCTVTTSDGEDLGTVADVFRVGESEVYTVRGPRGEVLVPAVGGVVLELTPQARRIVVDALALGLDEPVEPPPPRDGEE